MKFITRYPRVLKWYSDSNWISDADEMKGTSGYVFTLGGRTIHGSLASKPSYDINKGKKTPNITYCER
jgi:hypothetical protein